MQVVVVDEDVQLEHCKHDSISSMLILPRHLDLSELQEASEPVDFTHFARLRHAEFSKRLSKVAWQLVAAAVLFELLFIESLLIIFFIFLSISKLPLFF